MKILITTEFSLSFQCGVTTAVINERKCLEALGHEVRILTIYKDKVSKYEDGVYYIRSNFPQLYKDSYAALILSDPIFEEIYEWNPDIVHSQCEFFTMACAKSRRYGAKNPMQVIPCGLDLEHMRKLLPREERTAIRAELGFKENDIVLVSVCRLSKEKNVKESIDSK